MKNSRYVIERKGNMWFREAGREAEVVEYQEFLTDVVERIREYLPQKYSDYDISLEKVPKNNVLRDSLRIVHPSLCEAVPIVYLDDLYAMYKEGTPMEDVLRSAAALFTYGMDYAQEMFLATTRACEREDNIIVQVVNTEKNLAMLQEVPHTDYLDLSVIYRHYIALPDGSFNLATVDHENQDNLGLELEELHAIALSNTRRLMPIKREHMGEQVYILSNKKRLLGANVLLFKGQLRWLARKCRSDVFLVASSIHEVMSIPVRDARLSFLRQTVRDANRSVVSPEEVLSDTVYRYDRERDLLLPAWDDEEDSKSWNVPASKGTSAGLITS